MADRQWNDMNNDGNKLDTLKQMLIEECDFNDAKTIHRIIVDRFNRERICNDTRTRYVSEQFAESIDDFINKYINEQ